MRKFIVILGLAVSYVSVIGAASLPVPECAPNCPWIR
jgi:hypothetical protein